MNALRAVLAGLAEDSPDAPAVLATVVRVQGSAYRGPGARRLFTADGGGVGLVSGGCLEGDLARRAAALTAADPVTLLRYDTSDPDAGLWEFGLGCRGVVDVLLERLDDDPPWAALIRAAQARHEPAVLVHHLPDGPVLALSHAGVLGDEAAAALDEGRSRYAADGSAFIEYIPPAPTLMVCGAGADAVPLVRMAKELGWTVAVIDPRHRPATRQRFASADEVHVACDDGCLRRLAARPRAAAVVMTHNAVDDERLLRALLPTPLAYLALLGPKHRTADLLRSLAAAGVPLAHAAKLRTPAGLDIGAETPAEIALSILAEAQAALAGRAGGPLRDRRRPIHDRAAAAPAAAERAERACAS
ncbi:MAG: XdhC family protein [Gemmataceae bacterium]